jgi:sugar/nucleoside kinase (ribokinase family)
MNPQDLHLRAADYLESHRESIANARVTVGLDGFVDEIISVVDKRESAERYTPFMTMKAFAGHIAKGAGISTNAELVVRQVKLGGNGPIMANALAVLGAPVRYIGNLGYPRMHPAFAEFAGRAEVHSIADPGHTDALEFEDGKLMLGKIQSLNEITWDNMRQRVGDQKLRDLFTQATLVGLQNWTMIPAMTDIWRHVLDEICPHLPNRPRRTLFLDLADPERRQPADILAALGVIKLFQRYFDTYLGLNEKEAFEIGHVLQHEGPTVGEDAVKCVARHVGDWLEISGVVVHPRQYALVASDDGTPVVHGPFTARPAISTGGGDHFNAGFCLGKIMGADNEVALQIGTATSGYYVRNARSPSVDDLVVFLRSL